jgi:hypothetical protein
MKSIKYCIFRLSIYISVQCKIPTCCRYDAFEWHGNLLGHLLIIKLAPALDDIRDEEFSLECLVSSIKYCMYSIRFVQPSLPLFTLYTDHTDTDTRY